MQPDSFWVLIGSLSTFPFSVVASVLDSAFLLRPEVFISSWLTFINTGPYGGFSNAMLGVEKHPWLPSVRSSYPSLLSKLWQAKLCLAMIPSSLLRDVCLTTHPSWSHWSYEHFGPSSMSDGYLHRNCSENLFRVNSWVRYDFSDQPWVYSCRVSWCGSSVLKLESLQEMTMS